MGKHASIVKIFQAVFLFLTVAASFLSAETAPRTVPRTTEAMLTPEFWIKNINGDPDRIIMTAEQIRHLNTKNQKRSLDTTDINGNPYSIRNIVSSKDAIGILFTFDNPLTLSTISGDSLRKRFRRTREMFEKRTYYDIRQIKFDEDMKRELITMTAEDSIPETIIPRYGILVKHSLNRILPTNLPGYGGPNSWLDQFQSASMDFATPVAILHSSQDSDWLYVRGEYSFGWIPAENVATGTPEAIARVASQENFILAVGHKVPVYADRDFHTFIADFYLGSRLPLRNSSQTGYEVIVPVRRFDGSLQTVTGWVKPDADVRAGFQPFTQRNIINTMFSLLGRPYGWADSNNERDCCGTIRSVFKTFGIFLPRWTTHQLHYSDHISAFTADTPKEVKYRLIAQAEPAITLVGHQGHICMYLGETDGRHYVIHQTGYDYTADDGTSMMVRHVNVNDTELEGGSLIDTWREITEFKP